MKLKRKGLLRTALCLALILAVIPVGARAAGGVAINEKNFPDQDLREYISTEFDADGDGVLSASEIENAQKIDLSDTPVANLTGLASLVSLKELDVSGSRVTAVPAAKNAALETLKISGCMVKSLDVSKNPALKELDVSDTKLTTLNVSRNAALETLNVSGCAFKTLDVSKNTALRELDCSGTGITALNVSANEALEVLNCAGNKLTALDVTENTALRELRCRENGIVVLDVSLNSGLEVLDCAWNGMNWLNVSANQALRELCCAGNTITALNLDDNPALERLDCSGNRLRELSVKQNLALEWLNCSGNSLDSLNVTGNRWLKHLSCSDNNLRKLALNKNPELEWVECWGNGFRALDISYSTKLLDAYRYGTNSEYKRHTIRSLARNGEIYEIGVDSHVLLQDGSVAAPLITAQPKDASAVEGKKVTFTMNAVGEGLYFQWFYRQPGSEEWYPLNGETGRKLTVTADKNNNKYRYLCEVINRGGLEQTERVTLSVIYKPEITRQPVSQSGVDGEKVSFMVVANGEKLTYQWYRLTPNSSSWDTINSGTSAKLTLTANEAHDGTKYRCVVSNEAGKVTSSEAKLSVLYKPSVTTQPKDATVAKGKYTTFTVKASGGALKYQWYIKLKGETSWTLIEGATDKTLEVRGTPKRDKSVYRCKVYNAAGQVYTDTVKLTVN